MKTFKNALGLLLFVAAASCAVAQEDVASDEGESVIATPNPLLWAVGTWDCRADYHTVDTLFVGHRTASTYTVFQDPLSPGVLHGKYREDRASTSTPVDFDDLWRVSIDNTPDSLGRVPASISIASTDGSGVTATGTDSGPGPGPNGILGATSEQGTITFSDGNSRSWHLSAQADREATKASLIVDYFVDIGGGALQLYLSLGCTLRPSQI